MSQCEPGGGGRWPDTTPCGDHGSCILNPAWGGNLTLALLTTGEQSAAGITQAAVYICQCFDGWSSSGDFVSAPYQFCHISQRALLPMWIVALLAVLLTLVEWVQVVRSYFDTASEQNRLLPGHHSSQANSRSMFARLAALCKWMWSNPTRRSVFVMLSMIVSTFMLAMTKIVDIARHIRGFPPDTTPAGNIGQAVFPTITYFIGSVAFLTSIHFSTVMWATSAQAFYSHVEGRRLMTHTYKTLVIAVISDWLCYLLAFVACIIWQRGVMTGPSSNYLDAYESIVALHIQGKGLATLCTYLCDVAIGRKMMTHLREHAATQEKAHLQQQARIAAAMVAPQKIVPLIVAVDKAPDWPQPSAHTVPHQTEQRSDGMATESTPQLPGVVMQQPKSDDSALSHAKEEHPEETRPVSPIDAPFPAAPQPYIAPRNGAEEATATVSPLPRSFPGPIALPLVPVAETAATAPAIVVESPAAELASLASSRATSPKHRSCSGGSSPRPPVGPVVRSQAELHAEHIAKMNDFVARLSRHHQVGLLLTVVWLVINTFFAWVPLLRSWVAYLLPAQILVMTRASRSFLVTLVAKKKEGRGTRSTRRSAVAPTPSPTNAEGGGAVIPGGGEDVLVAATSTTGSGSTGQMRGRAVRDTPLSRPLSVASPVSPLPVRAAPTTSPPAL